MDTYCCPQPACPTFSPLVNTFGPCKGDSVPAVQVSIRDTSKCSASVSDEHFCWALGIPGYPVSGFVPCELQLPAPTDVLDGSENHRRLEVGADTKEDTWENGAKPSRLVLPRNWLQMAENDRGELNLWHFCHWKGTKYLMLLYNFCCTGLCLK